MSQISVLGLVGILILASTIVYFLYLLSKRIKKQNNMSCKLNIRYKEGFYRVFTILIKMIKKSIGTQIAILLGLGAGLFTFALLNFNTQFFVFNTYLKSYKPYLILISIILFIPPIINLYLQAFSKNGERYDERLYYKVLKSVSHLSFFLLLLLNLAWASYFLFYLGIEFLDAKLLLIIIGILIIITLQIINSLMLKHFKVGLFDYSTHLRR